MHNTNIQMTQLNMVNMVNVSGFILVPLFHNSKKFKLRRVISVLRRYGQLQFIG
jgi:hypothetical protein